MTTLSTTIDPVSGERSATPNTNRKFDRTVTDWYKDAIIYQLHVKAFQDANGDGIGDFAGLLQRLNYIEELGVNTIWLLPFYPSPLRDDGYDIADYLDINASYGDLDQFKAFLDEAHRRGIRVITELVINHTSDQHPWFQAARNAPPGSRERDFYVWSDTDQRYQDTRIIFLDTEKSNWTWDDTANAYFWHRFYSHQPDLNFDNPEVFDEVIKALRHWLDMGVDGLRLDAVPYLCEREGTNNENLRETHDVLKRIRAEVDRYYPDRMLLAEANQWPEDTRPYFGNGEECHMAFHFPLMPRMYMALAQEDRYPITDILRQTPEIPSGCQWALFLRNHDELTLEMVTEDERDYLWHTYASDPRARINLGIRRRLAPLLDNDRRKIELLNVMLLSMPGTPVIYYGDELGMGDNYYLGDRDGVRTPMQWSADRNGGFSRADPQRLYLPPIMDANFGYQAINVEAQHRDPSSLLNWTRRMIAVRKLYPAFGRGELSFLYPTNRKVLAFIRDQGDHKILCVFNLSSTAQAVELDLTAYRGVTPIELGGNSPFPSVGELPYMLTMPGYGYYWFELAMGRDEPAWRSTPLEPAKELVTAVFAQSWDGLLDDRERGFLERASLPEFVARQRWYAGKDARIRSITLEPIVMLAAPGDGFALTQLHVLSSDGGAQRYFLPLSALWGADHVAPSAARLAFTPAKLRRGSRVGALLDATHDDRFALAIVNAVQNDLSIAAENGEVVFEKSGDWPPVASETNVRSVGADHSNNALIVDERILVKIYRRLQAGLQPEIEMSRHLSQTAGFSNTPALLGLVEHRSCSGNSIVLGALFDFVRNQGDCWQVIVEALGRHLDSAQILPFDAVPVEPDANPYIHPLDLPRVIGQRTAEMHKALAVPSADPAFAPEKIAREDVEQWVGDARVEIDAAFEVLARNRSQLDEATAALVERLLSQRSVLEQRFEHLAGSQSFALKTRIHGDYHLGQILVAENDVYIIDFEGEPRRSVEERLAKTSPLRDVAGLMRSLDYVTWAALDRVANRTPQIPDHMKETAVAWRGWACDAFLDAYWNATNSISAPAIEQRETRALLDFFMLQKAAYEISYEAANRPGWISIPLRGMLDLLTDRSKAGES
ncbi:MAG: maltose alpha-D-glucosyltransferase [Hyphomicrobiaceae bacterium]